MHLPSTVTIESTRDLSKVRWSIRQLARQIGLGAVEITKVTTAASELARNMIQHGGGRGRMRLRKIQNGRRLGMELIFSDQGPGIEDLDAAMERGYSSRGGMGLGLPGARRLVSEFQVRSRPGQGTQVTVRQWKS